MLNTPVVDGAGFGYDRVPFAILEKGKPVPELLMRSKAELAEDVVKLVSAKREAFDA